MSCSWVDPHWADPHFAALYARREEERLAERLLTRLRDRAACEAVPSRRTGLRERGIRWRQDP